MPRMKLRPRDTLKAFRTSDFTMRAGLQRGLRTLVSSGVAWFVRTIIGVIRESCCESPIETSLPIAYLTLGC